jgi:hypothetical protein
MIPITRSGRSRSVFGVWTGRRDGALAAQLAMDRSPVAAGSGLSGAAAVASGSAGTALREGFRTPPALGSQREAKQMLSCYSSRAPGSPQLASILVMEHDLVAEYQRLYS